MMARTDLLRWSLQNDLAAIFAALESDWRKLADKRIFMTGGTGLIGRWMLEALADADRRLGLGARVRIVTRDPAAFEVKAPHLASNPAFEFVRGDVLWLEPDGETYDYVIHAATDASADLNENDPRRMFDTVVTGTRRALDFALAAQAKRFFFLSSGAVYGAQPWEIERVPEDYMGAPDLTSHRNAYAEGKRAAEMLCAIYSKQFGLEIVNARIFALLGPLLSLDIHFAAGNFIRDAMAGRKVVVQSTGTAVRSYLYLADLTVWLWAIVLRAAPYSVYNVGSEDGISIAQLAERVATLLGDAGFEVSGEPDAGWNPGRYVPSTAKIRGELGLSPTVELDEAIRRTAIWNGWKE
jgi:UDP-glucuronate decarboxylase